MAINSYMSFTNGELKKAIQDSLNDGSIQIPDGHKSAFLLHYDESGVRGVLAYKPGDSWEVSGEVGWHPDSTGLNFGVNVMKTWG